MTRFPQLLSSAAPADAVTGQALAWRTLLQLWGHESEVVAEHVDYGFRSYVHLLRHSARQVGNAEAIGLHYSIASQIVDSAFASDAGLVLCYHNVTPGELLRRYSPRIARLCDRGRWLLPRFRGRVAIAIADSAFNADELERSGIGNPVVVPLLLNVAERPAPLRPTTEAPIIVFVGRIAPNKRLDLLIRAFDRYRRRRQPKATLALVGTDVSFERYRRDLESLVRSLDAKRVVFTGRVSTAERDAWYDRASAYVSTSAHEGFCAPLVEALAHGVPVVARAAAAIPETLGGAGLLVEGEDVDELAEAIHDVTSNQQTRASLAIAAERRLAELRPEVVAGRLRAALEPVLG